MTTVSRRKVEEYCVNCNKFFNDIDRCTNQVVQEFKVCVNANDEDKSSPQLKSTKLKSVMWSLFRLDFLENSPQSTTKESTLLNENEVRMCRPCASALANMYKSYLELARLRKLESFMSIKLKEIDSRISTASHQNKPRDNRKDIYQPGPWVRLTRLTPQEISTKTKIRHTHNAKSHSNEVATTTIMPTGRLENKQTITTILPAKQRIESEVNSRKRKPQEEELVTDDNPFDDDDDDIKILSPPEMDYSDEDEPPPKIPCQNPVSKNPSSLTTPIIDKSNGSHLKNLRFILEEIPRTTPNSPSSSFVKPVPMVSQTVIQEKSKEGPFVAVSYFNNRSTKFSCTACKLDFTSIKEFGIHLVQTHSVPTCENFCTMLGSEEDRSTHMKTAHNIPPDTPVVSVIPKNNNNPSVDETQVLYPCPDCDESFLKKRSLENHVRSRHKIELPCGQCEMIFTSRLNLWRHVLGNHGLHSCPGCPEQFPDNRSLLSHFKSEHPTIKTTFLCRRCKQMFMSMDALDIHTSQRHKKEKKSCKVCKQLFDSTLELKAHVKSSHAVEFICDVCGVKMSQKDKLARHVKIHWNFKCEGCREKFETEESLESHKKSCRGAEQFSSLCVECGKILMTKEGFKRHMMVHEGTLGERQKFSCTHKGCDRKFATSSKLIIHQRRHTGERPFSCDTCHGKFISKTLLKSHMLTHAAKSFQCETCSMMFNRARSLREHQRVHSDFCPYVCGVCDKRFKRSEALKHHSFIHKGRTLKCPYCVEAFKLPQVLKKHIMRHTGERPYECKQCHAGFIEKRGLKKHELKHLMEEEVEEVEEEEENLEEVMEQITRLRKRNGRR